MALTKVPVAEPIIKNEVAKAIDEVWHTAVVDEQYNSQLGLLNYSAGMTEEVTYFEQLLGTANEQAEFQLNRDSAEQQYRRIDKFPVKLQSSLTTSFDSQNNRFTSEGTLVMPAMSKPYIGNMLLFTGLDHRIAIYSITRITPKNISLAPAYECDISFQRLLDEKWMNAIDEKTKEVAVYDRDQLKHGKNPVLSSLRYNRKYDYYRLFEGLADAYYREFYSRQRQTMLVPGMQVQTYDPWATDAFLTIYSSIDGKDIWGLGKLNVDDDQMADSYSVYQWAIDSKPGLEHRMTVEFGLRATQNYYRFPAAGSIRYSGVHRCVWPARDPKATMRVEDWLDDPQDVRINRFMNEAPPLDLEGVPLTPPLFDDSCYVFTENFYRNKAPMTVIENQVRTMVDGGQLDHRAIQLLADRMPYLQPIERYYFTPFVLMLLRTGALQP